MAVVVLCATKRVLSDFPSTRSPGQADLQLLGLRAAWNANLPVHKLPAEVFLQIFQHFLPLHHSFIVDAGGLQRPWVRLMGVCRHWCALIRNAACFWRDIEVRTKDVRWLKLALGRLGKTPVRVEARIGSLNAVLPILLEHTDHLETLDFQGWIHHSDIVPFISRLSSPVLTNLRFELCPLDPDATLPIWSGDCPRLRRLTLIQVSLPWSTSILAGLEVLSLTHCQLSTPSLPFADFLGILEHGQKLRALRLEHFLSAAVFPQTFGPGSHARCVTLPSLHRLACHDVPARVAQLMAHLRIPAILEIDLAGKWPSINDPSIAGTTLSCLLPEDLTRVLPQVPQSIPSARLQLEVDSRELHCSLPIELRLSFRVPPTAQAGILEQEVLLLLPVLCGHALTEMYLSGELTYSLETWNAVFEAFPSLQKLTLDNTLTAHEFPVDVFPSLQAAPALFRVPQFGGIRERRCEVHCPVLRELLLYHIWWRSHTMEVILECLRSRAASGALRLEILELAADWKLPQSMDIDDEHDQERFRTYVDKFVLL